MQGLYGSVQPNWNLLMSERLCQDARSQGLSVKVLRGFSDESYSYFYAKSKGQEIEPHDVESMCADLRDKDTKISDRKTIIIELHSLKNHKMIGFVSCEEEEENNDAVLDIVRISISKEEQGKGYGVFLMSCVKSTAENSGFKKLSLVPENNTSGFYQKSGMRVIDTRSGDMELEVEQLKFKDVKKISHLDLAGNIQFQTTSIPQLDLAT